MKSHHQSHIRPRVEPLEDRLAPATFTVKTAVDEDTPNDGLLSLREAITAANATPGADRIEFAIGSGLQTINLLTALPDIKDPVTIAGQTQPGPETTPRIELNGAAAGAGADGLKVRANGVGSVIRGLVINGFSGGAGIHLLHTSCTVQGCFIGTSADGLIAAGNGIGIDISSNHFVTGAGSTIGGAEAGWGNLISGNLGHGVNLVGDVTRAVIQGNFIGTDVTGGAAVANGGDGVHIWFANGNQVGGSTTGAGNVISGNTGSGVVVDGLLDPRLLRLTTDNTIRGNLIGTSADGTTAVPNGGDGVALLTWTGGNRIGGTAAGARNIISGNTGNGVSLTGGHNTGNKVRGNFIGTQIDGTTVLPNTLAGVLIQSGASDNLIGGTDAGSRNVISGNTGSGVQIEDEGTTGNLIQGNRIGTDRTGKIAQGNGGAGVLIASGAADNLVGGPEAEARNIISANTGAGVELNGAGTGNKVKNNYIGTKISGFGDLGNTGPGVSILSGTSNTKIGGTAAGNIISGNDAGGVFIDGIATTGNIVLGNFIGTDRTGQGALGNTGPGVVIQGGANGNIVGGTAAGARNVIARNNDGVRLSGTGTSNNQVLGNLIGTDVTGTIDLGNSSAAVHILSGASFDLIGTADPGARNILSGGLYGVWIEGPDTTQNKVRGNYIGTDVTGTVDLGNTSVGVYIINSSYNRIGGWRAGAGNLISGNDEHGVQISGKDSSYTFIVGNWIGLAVSGAALPNTGSGVYIDGDANYTDIGTPRPGAGNVIARNGGNGVTIVSGTVNWIRVNSIYGNGGLGIQLPSNHTENPPVLESARLTPSGLEVSGSINTAPDQKIVRIEFFVSPTGDPSGFGEGKTFLGFVSVTTDASGNATFQTTLPSTGVSAGQVVTATATIQYGNTSEFTAWKVIQ